MAVDHVGNRLDRMFESADDLLFQISEQANSAEAKRSAFDAVRVLRLERLAIRKVFLGEFAKGFSIQPASAKRRYTDYEIDDLTLRDARLVEESIALQNMESKGESLYRNQLWDLGRRLEWLIQKTSAPLAQDALSPGAICRAFQRSTGGLKLELGILLLFFKIFDRSVICELSPLYDAALRLLIENGVDVAPRPGLRPPGHERTPHRRAGDEASVADKASGLDPSLIPLLLQLSSALAPGMAPYQIGDAALASGLAAAIQGRPVNGWGERQRQAYAQRTDLVGRMFSDLFEGVRIADDTQQRFDQFRFAAVKSALKDPGFFANPAHPVRNVINELAMMAAMAQAMDSDSRERFAQLLDDIRRQFEDSATGLLAPSESVDTIDEQLIDQFIGSVRRHSSSRRKWIVKRVREIVSAELRVRTDGKPLPEDVTPLLYSGWSVLMAVHLMHHGICSEQWNGGLDQLEQILRAVHPTYGERPEPQELEQLRGGLRESLLAIGVEAKRVEEMLAGFERATGSAGDSPRLSLVISKDKLPDDAATSVSVTEEASIKADAAPLAPDADHGLVLDLLLVVGRWFQIFDQARNERRWLKYVGCGSGESNLAVFAEFNGRNALELSVEQVVDDLVNRRCNPIDAPPAARQALDTMIAHRRRQAA